MDAPAPLLHATTSALPTRERFSFWHETVSDQFRIRTERLDDAPFWGEVRARQVGELSFAEVASAGLHGVHGRADVARTRAETESVYYLTLQAAGGCAVLRNRQEASVSAGDFFVLDPLREFELHAADRFRQICLQVPRHWIEARVPRPDLVSTAVVTGTSPIGRLLMSYLTSGYQFLGGAGAPSSTLMMTHVVDLIAEAVKDVSGAAPPASVAMRAALHARACQLIALRFADPGLAPGAIARALAISPRLLHRIFSEQDDTVMRRVLRERVAQAARQLAMPQTRHRSITEIALSCGFNDSSHFGRVFVAQMQLTPSEWRRLHH